MLADWDNTLSRTVELPARENIDFHRPLGADGCYLRTEKYILLARKNLLCTSDVIVITILIELLNIIKTSIGWWKYIPRTR